MKKLLILLTCILLTSCSQERYSTQIFGYFDTVVNIDGYFDNEEEFQEAVKITEETLKEYHALFDIHTSGKLKTLNEEKISFDKELINAINFGINVEEVTNGRCNIALGSLLSLWHEARENKILPSGDLLRSAAHHTDISKIQIEENKVILLDPDMSLDFGAIAKGYVADILREKLTKSRFEEMIVNLGGNVLVIGDKDGNGWNIGIQDPENENALVETIKVSDSSLVTSGVYQRYFEVNGQRYHHIISPDTLYPADDYLSVSVLYKESAWADALSTALFCMPIEEGEQILEKFENIGALWIKKDGTKHFYGTLKK